MVALARKTLVHDWRRFLPAIIAVAFAGVLQLIQAALVLGDHAEGPVNHVHVHADAAGVDGEVVLEDGQQARKIGIRGQRYFMESLAYWYTGGERPDHTKWQDDVTESTTGQTYIKSRWASEVVEVDFSDPSLALANPNHAYGTVEDCIGYVERLRQAGADEILFICQMGTVPQWAQLETIRNIGEHVIPYFRNQTEARKPEAVPA